MDLTNDALVQAFRRARETFVFQYSLTGAHRTEVCAQVQISFAYCLIEPGEYTIINMLQDLQTEMARRQPGSQQEQEHIRQQEMAQLTRSLRTIPLRERPL